jgi:hypothetical protein
VVRAAAALSAAALLAGCAGIVGPSRTVGDYAHKAANTAEALGSAVATAKLTAELSAKDRLTSAAISVSLREAYDDASSVIDGFDSVQPPGDEADAIRGQLDEIAKGAVDAIQVALVHARRGQDLGRFIPALDEAAKALEGFHPGHGA